MDTLLVALVGGLVGGAAAALIGGAISLTAQRREHAARRAEVVVVQAHERAMAREQRLQDRRARAYERVLVHVYRLVTWIERTEPVVGPVPHRPEPAPDEEVWHLNALTAAYASPEVQGFARALSDRVRRIGIIALMVADERAGHPTGQEVPPRQQLDDARTEFDADVRALGDRIAAELRGDV